MRSSALRREAARIDREVFGTAPPCTRTVQCHVCEGHRGWFQDRGIRVWEPCNHCSSTGNEPCAVCGEWDAEVLVPVWIPATPTRDGTVGAQHVCPGCELCALDEYVSDMRAIVTTDISRVETLGDEAAKVLANVERRVAELGANDA